ncbi:MAG: hypothetical protein ACI4RU_02100 [Acutalibacteraceae bacterium]
MKKVLSILLAALMAFSTFGMFSFAADPEISEDVFTLQDALDIASSMKNGEKDVAPTVLVFNTGSAKLGTVYMTPQVYYINAGANKGCYALISEAFAPGNAVQLPAIKDAGDGMAANWMVQTNISEQGRTYGSASTFVIPLEMEERAKADPNSNYIVFYATLTPNEQTPTIAKIMNIFYKIIKVLFGQDLANKFGELMLEFGIEIED